MADLNQTMLPSEEGEIARLNALCFAQQKLISDLIEAAEKLLASDQPGHWDAFRHYDARKELLAALLKAKGGE
jgi:hypothetical protein